MGLGKTIEASLIYLELKARGDLPRVLVACPSALRDKWQSELKLRFDEDFVILDRQGLTRFFRDYQGTGGLQRLKAIASIELLRDSEVQQGFVENGVTLDLLVIDEAHHAKNAATETHKSARMLADRADNVILLTATPLQTDTSDLFNLLQLVDAASFNDPLTFSYQLSPNRHVNAAIASLGEIPPDLETAKAALGALRIFPETKTSPILDIAERVLDSPEPALDQLVALRRDLLELNTLSYVFTRTRKRDVQNSAKRTSMTLRVELSPEERAFYDAMVAQVRHEVRVNGLPAFLVAGRERQAASCLIATRRYLETAIRTRTRDPQLEDADTELDSGSDERVDQGELDRLRELVALSKEAGEKDSKLDRLLADLPAIMEEAANGKVLIFAFYRRTLEHLEAGLHAAGVTTFLMHGGVASSQRQVLMERFREANEPCVLLSSEVGAEGLDFQFADTLINYDLPWNPMKVEQRIGRIDRYGQTSPRIRIISLVLDDTIETRIVERLYHRIRIFEESIGDLEPIVGPEVRRLERDVLSRNLTPEEEVRLADEMARRLENLRQLQDDFDRKSVELMAPDSLFLSDVTKAVESGRVISAEELAVVVQLWLAEKHPESDFKPSDDDTWLLRPSPSLVAAYRDFLARAPEKSDRAVALLHAMDSRLGVPCTFNDHMAQRRRPLHFLHVRHPFVRLAIEYFQTLDLQEARDDVRIARIEADAPASLAGTYTFFLNVIRVDAINPQMRFVPVVFDDSGAPRPDVAERLIAWLQGRSATVAEPLNLGDVTAAYERQHEVMRAERERVESLATERNLALLETRQSHVERSFRAKIAKRREWLLDARDPRIQRMREAEIGNLEEQRREKLTELERGRVVRVTYELVTGGVVTLVGNLPDVTVLGSKGEAEATAPGVVRAPRTKARRESRPPRARRAEPVAGSAAVPVELQPTPYDQPVAPEPARRAEPVAGSAAVPVEVEPSPSDQPLAPETELNVPADLPVASTQADLGRSTSWLRRLARRLLDS